MPNLGSVGTVFAEVEADIAKFKAQIKQVIPEAEKVANQAAQAFSQGFSQASHQYNLFAQEIAVANTKLGGQMSLLGENIGHIGVAARDSTLISSQSFAAFQKAVAEAGNEAVRTTGYFGNIKQAVRDFGSAVGEAATVFSARFGPALNEFSSHAKSLGTTLSVGVSLPLVGLGVAAIKASADIESLRMGLTAIAGSSESAGRQLEELREVAKLPGLNFKEAVQGAINLEGAGFSAEKTKDILLSFGNALATVGRTGADLDGVIRQLQQMASKGVVLEQDLRPILDRIPQLAKIIKEQFGEEAIGNPAKVMEKLGINSKQFIEILTRELAKAPLVVGGVKNAFANLADSVTISLAKLGDEAAPDVAKAADLIANALKSVTDQFVRLPPEIKQTTLVLGGLAAATGPAISGLGFLTEASSDVLMSLKALKELGAEFKLGSVAAAAGTASLAVASFGAAILVTQDNLSKLETQAKAATDELIRLRILDLINTGKSVEQLQAMGFSLEQIRGIAKETTITITEAGIAVDKFKAPLQGTGIHVIGLAGNMNALGESAKKIVAAQKELQSELDKAQRDVDELTAAVKRGEPVQDALAMATRKVAEAFAKAHPEVDKFNKAVRDFEADLPVALPVLEDFQDLMSRLPADLADFRAGVEHHINFNSMANDFDEIIRKITKAGGAYTDFGSVIIEQSRAAAEGLRALSDEMKFSLQAGMDEIKKKTSDANRELQQWTGVVQKLAPIQGTAAANSQEWGLAIDRLKRAFIQAHPELEEHDAAWKQFLSDMGLATVAQNGMTTVLINGIPVLRGTTEHVKTLNDAARAGADSARSFGKAWSDAAVAIRDADGNIKVLTKDVQLAAQLNAQAAKDAAAFAQTSQGTQSRRADAGFNQSIKGQSGNAFELSSTLAAGTSGFFGAAGMPELGVRSGGLFGPNDLHNAFVNMQLGEATFGRLVKIAGQWVVAGSEAADELQRLVAAASAAVPAINQFGESMSGVGDAARKDAQIQKDLNDATLAAGDAARELQEQINRTYDEMQALRFAGQETSPQFLTLQTRLIDLSQQLSNIRGVSASAASGLNSVAGAVAQVAGISAGATAVIDAAVVRSVAMVSEAARFLDMGPMPAPSTLSLPSIPSGPLAGAMTLGPGNATVSGAGFRSPGWTFEFNVNGGNFTSDRAAQELFKQFTDQMRLQLSQHL